MKLKAGDLVRRIFISPEHEERYERFNSQSELGIVVEVDESAETVAIMFNGSNRRTVLSLNGDHLEVVNERE